MSDCIFEIHQLWKPGFSRVYSNSFCSCSFEPEIKKKKGQSSYKMYSNNILNSQVSMTILNAHTKEGRKLIVCTSYIRYLMSTHFLRIFFFCTQINGFKYRIRIILFANWFPVISFSRKTVYQNVPRSITAIFTDNVRCQRENFSPNWQKAPPHTNATAIRILSRLASSLFFFYIVHPPPMQINLLHIAGDIPRTCAASFTRGDSARKTVMSVTLSIIYLQIV